MHHLSNHQLIETLEKAKQLSLDKHFILLIFLEMEKRQLNKQKKHQYNSVHSS